MAEHHPSKSEPHQTLSLALGLLPGKTHPLLKHNTSDLGKPTGLIYPGALGSSDQESRQLPLYTLPPKLATSAHIHLCFPALPLDPPLACSSAQPAGSNLPGTCRWPSLVGSVGPSLALHPRGGGSARSAASSPFPIAMNQALWNLQRNQGSLAAVFLGEVLSQISGEAPRLGFPLVQQNLRRAERRGAGLLPLPVRKHFTSGPQAAVSAQDNS